MQAETQRQEVFNLEEWMTPECLEDIAHDLELLATTQGREAVVLAAGTLTGEIRDIIEQLLLGFNIAID